MRFVYLFKIYSNRIVKVKSAFLRKDRDAAIDISARAAVASRHGDTQPCYRRRLKAVPVTVLVTACRQDGKSAAGPLFS